MNKLSFTILAGIALLFAACESTPTEPSLNEADMTIKGSETELPLIGNFVDTFQSKNKLTISLAGGGSNAGLRSLMDQQIDIATSSRVVTEEEKEKLQSEKVKWTQVIIGADAIAIITNKDFQIESLSLQELSAIFSGKVTNWNDVGGPNRPINMYGRNSNSGTHDYMKHRLAVNYSPKIREYETYAQILDQIKSDPNGIAYVSASCIKNTSPKEAEVHVVNVQLDNEKDYSPFDEEAINTGEYAFIRPLFQYYNASNKNPWIRKFIGFEMSPSATAMLKKNGYYPINVFHQQINSFNSIE